MCWNHKSHCFIHSRSGFCLRQWDMRVFAYTVPFSHCLYNFRFLVTDLYFWHVYWLAAIQYQLTEVHMLIWTLCVLTFAVPYPAHSKLVFMHAFCLTFPVSILSRVQVVSHPFFQKKKIATLSASQVEPPSSRHYICSRHNEFWSPLNLRATRHCTYRQEAALGRGKKRGGVEAS